MVNKFKAIILFFFIAAITPLSAQVASKNDYVLLFQNVKDELVKVTVNDNNVCANPEINIVDNPKHGTATIVSDSIIKYTPTPDYIGKDSLEYKIINCGASNTAILYINIVPLQDNINDSAACLAEVTGSIWDMSLLKESTVKNVSTLSMILAGDVDGDGKVEIIVSEYGVNAYYGSAILIFDENLAIKHRIAINHSSIQGNIAIANVDGGSTAAIFVTSGNRLVKFKFDGTTYVKDWDVSATSNRGAPVIADLDNDGLAEVLIWDKIYDAKSGLLLATGSNFKCFGLGGHHMGDMTHSHMVPVDIDGDGKLEVVAGNCVYSVTIDRINPSLGKYEILRTADIRADVGDGATSVADMDLDGYPDVVVTRARATPSTGALYIWNPRTGKIMNENIINNIPALFSGYAMGPSVPFIGDLDGDKIPEIALTGVYRMFAYKYDISTKQLNVMWDIATTDRSGSTTMSLFDFNQDKNFELVFRDEDNLRILNGSTGTDLHQPIPFGSNTGNEYPIVVDVNNDGRAEIVVVGGIGTAAERGTVRIYGNENWAPARKVWNQFSYNVVNVNEDLTIPKHQLNVSTIFPGEDGILNTDDDVRPYNGFLMQQTILNRKGTPLFTIPEAQVGNATTLFNYNKQKDSLTITFTVNNTGEAALRAPFNITIYKDAVSVANKVHTFPYNEQINVGIKRIDVGIPNFSTLAGVITSNTKFILKINDNGNTNDDQEVCGNTNTTLDYSLADFIKINTDNIAIIACDTLLIDVLKNDNILPNFILHKITVNGKYGTATIKNGEVEYISKPTDCCTFKGNVDTMQYVVCNDVNEDYCDTAMLIIDILPCPDIILFDSCSFHPKMKLAIQYLNAAYLWQYVEESNYNGDNTIWTDMGTGVTSEAISQGYYRVRINYNGEYRYTSHYKLIQNEKVKISNKWWYRMSLE